MCLFCCVFIFPLAVICVPQSPDATAASCLVHFYSSDGVPRRLLRIQRLYYRPWFMLRMQGWSTLISIFLAPFITFVAHHCRPTYKCLRVSIWAAVFVFHLGIGLLESASKPWSQCIHFQYVIHVCCGSFWLDCLFSLTNEPAYIAQIRQTLSPQYQCMKIKPKRKINEWLGANMRGCNPSKHSSYAHCPSERRKPERISKS